VTFRQAQLSARSAPDILGLLSDGRQIALFSAGLACAARCAITIACVALIAMTLVEGCRSSPYVLNDSPSWTERWRCC